MCRSIEMMREEVKIKTMFETLYSLVLDGILTLAQAAERMGVSEAEFAERIAENANK